MKVDSGSQTPVRFNICETGDLASHELIDGVDDPALEINTDALSDGQPSRLEISPSFIPDDTRQEGQLLKQRLWPTNAKVVELSRQANEYCTPERTSAPDLGSAQPGPSLNFTDGDSDSQATLLRPGASMDQTPDTSESAGDGATLHSNNVFVPSAQASFQTPATDAAALPDIDSPISNLGAQEYPPWSVYNLHTGREAREVLHRYAKFERKGS